MKKLTVVLLTLGTIGFLAIPARAGKVHDESNDQVVIQETIQNSYINGEGNNSSQKATQINHTRRENRQRNDSSSNATGVVQTIDQYSDVAGYDNKNRQTVQQGNSVTEIRQRRRR